MFQYLKQENAQIESIDSLSKDWEYFGILCHYNTVAKCYEDNKKHPQAEVWKVVAKHQIDRIRKDGTPSIIIAYKLKLPSKLEIITAASNQPLHATKLAPLIFACIHCTTEVM